MKNPQTLAEELYKHFPTPKLKAIKDYACCAFSLIYWLGIDCSDVDAIMLVSDLMKHNALDPDCTVYWSECIKQLTGREMKSLEKVQIKDIKKIKERTIVKFSNGGYSHWVGVEGGKVVFDPKGNSKTIAEGKPVLIKVLKF